MARYEDGVLLVSLNPPAPIGGDTIRWTLQHRFGGISGYAVKYLASGYNGVSGITCVNSGEGIFSIAINSADTSGLEYGNYASLAEKLDTRTQITRGYLSLLPGGLP